MRRIRPTTTAFLTACAAALLITTAAARAGVVPLSRDTTLRVQGLDSSGSYDRTDGTANFGTFSNLLQDSTAPAGDVTRSSAQQLSTVANDASDFGGSTESEATARVAEIGGQAAFGESLLVVRFQVTGNPEPYDVGGSLGGTLGGSAFARLVNDDTSAAVFDRVVDQGSPEGGVQFDESGLLQPGTYTLSVRAFATGTPSPESAFANATFAIGAAPNPIPLPPAAWAGLLGLLLAGGASVVARRRARA